jgi:hypothetical protein
LAPAWLFLAFAACDGVVPWPIPIPDEAGLDAHRIADVAVIDRVVPDVAPAPPDAAIDGPSFRLDAGADVRFTSY